MSWQSVTGAQIAAPALYAAARRCAGILVALLLGLALQVAAAEDSHRIDAGDTISISVYGEPDLDLKPTKVPSNGRVAVPLIGDVNVRGLTGDEVRKNVTKLFADGYLKKPSVTVSVDRLQLYYIKGEVKKPGGYRFVEGLSVEKAIALAGGYTQRASEEDVTILSESAPGKPGGARKRAPLSTPVAPGDVITIGESFF